MKILLLNIITNMNTQNLLPIVYLGYGLVSGAVVFFFHFIFKYITDERFRASVNSRQEEYDPNRPRIKDSLGGLIISHTVIPDKKLNYEEFYSNIKNQLNSFYFEETLPVGLKLGKLSKRVRI